MILARIGAVNRKGQDGVSKPNSWSSPWMRFEKVKVLGAIYFFFLTIYFCLQPCPSLSIPRPGNILPPA
jgi:hypothetical protein